MSQASSTKKSGKLTPMMEQYRSIQRTLPSDTILFFRLGDFYEMFFEDAAKASEILNITLTGRGSDEDRVPMCGFPHHAFTSYVKQLLDENLKVAVCEQIGDPKKSKGLVERKVTRVITPATYLDDEAPEQRLQYIACIYQRKEEAVVSYLELSTGEFYVREIPAEKLTDELMLIFPREVVVPKSLEENEELNLFLRETLGASISFYEDWVYDSEEAGNRIQSALNLSSLSSISFCDREMALGACGALIYYLKDHFHEALSHLQAPKIFQSQEFMILDRGAQKSLEFLNNSQGKRGFGTLFSVLNRTKTAMGNRALENWISRPLLNLSEIKSRQEAIGEFLEKSSWTHDISSLLHGVKDIERTLSRLNYGVANARDLVNLKMFLNRIPELRNFIAKSDSDLISAQLTKIQPFPKLNELIEKSIVEEPPLTIKEGGMILEGYSKELDELRDISGNGKKWILEFQKREAERTGIKNLKIKYSQVFGYAIEVSKGQLNSVPDDYIRRQTLANAERFVVPELKEWDEKISGAQDKIKALEYELFISIREKVLEELVSLQEMAKAVGILDVLISLSVVASEKRWVLPKVDESLSLEIVGGRHPVVESMLPKGKFVENDTHLNSDDQQLIILTGPNMAGKSTYIRQVAHITLLAQLGSYVPAEKAHIGIVDRIFTRIGASDDLARGESTFMVEMLETANILNETTDRSLLILDEVGRGTSTFDGVSIAWAICEFLAGESKKPRTLFATHYHELTQLVEHFPRVKNYTIKVKETGDKIVFLRKVVEGATDRSYGIHVAELAGLPKEVILRAKKILKVLESENKEATEIIESGLEKRSSNKSEGPSLFDFAAENHPLLDELKDLDVNDLTPLEALQKLNDWKKKL